MSALIHKFQIIKTDQFPEYDLKVTLKPSFKCNHACWFCNEYDNKSTQWSESDCATVIFKLSQIPASKKRIFFYFYGGEPTLSKHWEYLNLELIKTFNDRELFLQTQTNLSIDCDRLETFLQVATTNTAKIDICSSYHLGKQSVDEFSRKLDLCSKYGAMGLCFFSTEIGKEEQFLSEFNILNSRFPNKIKLKFTEIENLTFRNLPEYKTHLTDSYLRGDDNGKSLEYRYFIRKYPHFREYFEEGWNFDIDGTVTNYSEIKASKVHTKFKHMWCECGRKSLVIDHNLQVYHCNDDYNKQIRGASLTDIDINTFLKSDVVCINSTCYDGLDHIKYRK